MYRGKQKKKVKVIKVSDLRDVRKKAICNLSLG